MRNLPPSVRPRSSATRCRGYSEPEEPLGTFSFATAERLNLSHRPRPCGDSRGRSLYLTPRLLRAMASDPDPDDEQTWQQVRPASLERVAPPRLEPSTQPNPTDRASPISTRIRSEVQTLERIVLALLVLVVVSLAISTVAIVLLTQRLK